jgi:ParB/RepB/Spo0J family partition protein
MFPRGQHQPSSINCAGGGVTLEAVETLPLEGVGMAKGDAGGIQVIPLNKIKLAKNSRMSVSSEELDGLMLSIKSVGLLQPIGVVKAGSGYEVCYGNRRFLACSKLGLSKITAVVHTNKREFDRDIKNLTENIQRRNLSLAECGRYIEILSKEGLSSRECAARLGVSISYVKGCQTAYARVPKEFRDDLEIKVSSEKLAPGKISIKTAQKRAINLWSKTFRNMRRQSRPESLTFCRRSRRSNSCGSTSRLLKIILRNSKKSM